MIELCFTPATELAGLYRPCKVSSPEVTDTVLAQIARVNQQLDAP